VAIGQSAQKFFKTYSHGRQDDNFLSCTSDPWQSGKLTTTAAPGEDNGPSCACNAQYLKSEESFQKLVAAYFVEFQGHFIVNAVSYLQNTENDFEQRKSAMNIICGRFQFDGDMAGSGAATDPLFWVAHGSLERLFQSVLFDNVPTDKVYPTGAQCSGHSATSTKYWLQGFFFEDETLDASTLTNEQLLRVLDPTDSDYSKLINYVYDDAGYSYCAASTSWFK